MSIKQILFRFVPQRYILPFWYAVQRITGAAESEIVRLSEFVPAGRVAVDAGANIGLFSYRLSRLCPRVEAFEPQPGCAEILTAYGAKNVSVHMCGLSDKAGELFLEIPVVGGTPRSGLASFQSVAGEHDTIAVPVKRLDDFHFRNVGFVKIDVEGHEFEVLRGAEETLLREKPVILIEIEQRHIGFPMDEIFSWIVARGYSGFFLEKKGLRPLGEFAYALHQEPYLGDVLAERYHRIRGKYVNNFLFFPAEAALVGAGSQA